MSKRLFIIRHGQTDLNNKGIVQGRGIDSPLNEAGLAQASAFYNRYRDVNFDHIYVSSLQRTYQTVESFINKGIPFTRLAELDEISWGIFEGLEQTPDILAGFEGLLQQWKSGLLDVSVDGGESPNQLILRQKQAMDYIVAQENQEQVLICMHGRALRVLLSWITEADPSNMDQFPHTNTALYVVKYSEGHFEIEDFYNVEHLKSLAV